jgi:hypothetical protein
MFVWLVLIYSERTVLRLFAGGWFVLREKYSWLVAGGFFVPREKFCWLVAEKPSEHGECPRHGWSTSGNAAPWACSLTRRRRRHGTRTAPPATKLNTRMSPGVLPMGARSGESGVFFRSHEISLLSDRLTIVQSDLP